MQSFHLSVTFASFFKALQVCKHVREVFKIDRSSNVMRSEDSGESRRLFHQLRNLFVVLFRTHNPVKSTEAPNLTEIFSVINRNFELELRISREATNDIDKDEAGLTSTDKTKGSRLTGRRESGRERTLVTLRRRLIGRGSISPNQTSVPENGGDASVVDNLRGRLAETESRLAQVRAREAALSRLLEEMKRLVSVMEILENYLKRRYSDRQEYVVRLLAPVSRK
ncbi:Protein SKIP34, partial [Cucurbita argyrosperma subsp. sororia]